MNPIPPDNASSVAQTVTETVSHVAEQATSTGTDPVMHLLAWLSGLIVALVALPKPIMALIRQYKTNSVDNARDDADQATFERQTKQIDKLTADVERIQKERDQFFTLAQELKMRVEKLEVYESLVARMKIKLDEKDNTISVLRDAIKERDDKILDLTSQLMTTNEKIHALEVRLLSDERTRCFNCTVNPLTKA